MIYNIIMTSIILKPKYINYFHKLESKITKYFKFNKNITKLYFSNITSLRDFNLYQNQYYKKHNKNKELIHKTIYKLYEDYLTSPNKIYDRWFKNLVKLDNLTEVQLIILEYYVICELFLKTDIDKYKAKYDIYKKLLSDYKKANPITITKYEEPTDDNFYKGPDSDFDSDDDF